MKKEANVILFLFIIFALAATNGASFGVIKNVAVAMRWILMFVMCIFYLLNLRAIKLDYINIFFGFFVVQAFASINYSINPNMTLQKTLLLFAMYLVVFFEIRRFVSCKEGFIAFYEVLVKYSKCIIIFTVVSIPIVGFGTRTGGRAEGIFENPNTLGLFSVIAVPTLLANFIKSKKKSDLIFLIIALGFLFLSGSRTSLVSTFLALLFYIIAAVKNKASFIIGTVFLFFLFLIGSQFIGGESITEKFENKFRTNSIEGLGGRSEAWEAAKEAIEKRPLLGHGYGSEEYLFDYYDIEFKEHYGSYIHNSYLGIIAEQGYLGLSFMIIILGGILLSCKRLYKYRNKTGPFKPVAMLYVALVLGLMLSAVAESWMFAIGSMVAMIFWSLAVTVLVLSNNLRRGRTLHE